MSFSPDPLLHVSRSDDGRIARLSLDGELDMSTSMALTEQLRKAEARRPAMLVLDLTHLRFMDVTGLRAILDAARRARREGRELIVTNPVPHILRLFELTAIDQSLELLRNPFSALSDGAAGSQIATA
jgi:anti-anti-sigma factor